MADSERSRTYQGIVAEPYSMQYNGDVHGGVHNTTSNVYNNRKSFHERLLDSLSFPGIDTYQMRPLESFPGTFEWMFDESKAVHSCARCCEVSRISGTLDEYCRNADGTFDYDKRWSLETCRRAHVYSQTVLDKANQFRSWIRSSQEIFWISGKAGAGKSCLMKFLLEHEFTLELLRETAGRPVHLVGFFFWAAGGELEKSHDGLLRSLLHQILREQPEMAVCLETSSEHAMDSLQPWTSKRLRKIFDLIVSSPNQAASFAFFIDGLDEFNGDLSDLIDTLNVLNRSPKIKLCVSSRPWNVFQDSYGSRDSSLQLHLHELTALDMDIYISGRLEKDSVCGKALSSNVDVYQVTDAVRDRAEGVFLWVSLAVKRLRRLMEDFSSTAEMLSAVRELPSELQSLLRHIFDKIEAVHLRSAARTFLLMLESFGSPVPTPWLLYLEDGAHVNWSIESSRLSRNGSRAAKRWCKDLVHLCTGKYPEHYGYAPFLGDVQMLESPIAVVEFPHRAVRDFIEERSADGSLWRLAEEPFCPAFTLCYSNVQLLLNTCSSLDTFDYAYFLDRGNSVRRSMERELVALATALDAHGQSLARKEGYAHYSTLLRIVDDILEERRIDGLVRFMGEALRHDKYRLFRLMLRALPELNTVQARRLWLTILLAHTYDCVPERVECLQSFEPGYQLDELLALPAGNTIWRKFLVDIHLDFGHWRGCDLFELIPGMVEVLLQHGGDPDIMLLTESLYPFLFSFDKETSLKSRPDFCEQLSLDNPDGRFTSFLERDYLPATAAFEVPSASTPHNEGCDRRYFEVAFPRIKTLLVAASKAKAAATAAKVAAMEAQHIRENPPTWESIALYL